MPVFLQGGGEMGGLIRNYDWAASPLGPPGKWPQSLCTTISIILNSRFPMFLFWGPELICFYNDAFRPSLGNEGKHPWALGKRGQDVWEEIWPTIKPWIDQVLSGGEAVWNEDQLVPFYRNGRIEDIYWTFSYSPVCDESGRRAGVLVTCTETTDKVETLRRIKTANERFEYMVMRAPVAIAVFRGDDLVAEIANDAYLPLTGKAREEFVGKPLFESLPETRSVLEPIVRQLMQTGEPFLSSEFELVVNRYGREQTCYFNFVYEPLREAGGFPNGFMVVAHEVTEQVLARKRAEESEARFRLLADTMPQFVWTSDPQGNLDYFNQAVIDYTGLSFEVINAEGWAQIVHPDEREENMRLWKHSVATGEDFIFHHRFRNRQGIYRWQLSRAVPLRDHA
ncbi:MAG TPA: PAS domain-containing protein, partial [Chitinophagaceae bacterium]